MNLDKSICTKYFSEFLPEEIYEMSKYIATTKGAVSISLPDKTFGLSITYNFSNLPKNNINILYKLPESAIEIKYAKDLVEILRNPSNGELIIYDQWPKIIIMGNDFSSNIKKVSKEGNVLFHQITEDPKSNDVFAKEKWILKLVKLYEHSIVQPFSDPRYNPFREFNAEQLGKNL